ncbi:sigma-70 family RNA polymerase sigma factor [Rhizobium sp. P38BS-XIX]|uniref:sigma-70 family RNA polymerase sigma factor n=1 Tax=Rhizobium sp. P38BS-XIX TaxID=2726740 RepID=UPI00145785D7|nr:sigma-70 family RNA polymerase sigma factor [Rhizobium sp. P38BS-XIX]NLS00407.1 sigma-70 family RNA polymerase sigma factor [Rhizobium sp. P38BS-XIX]
MLATAQASVQNDLIALLPALRNFARRFVSNQTDIDDLTQETVTKVLGHLDSFTPGTSLKSWAFTIMRNTFLTDYKRRTRVQLRAMDDRLFEIAIPSCQQHSIYVAEVGLALDRLPNYQREALLMIVDGVSYERAAQRCGCEIGTIKSRVSRARAALVEMLGESSLHGAASIH